MHEYVCNIYLILLYCMRHPFENFLLYFFRYLVVVVVLYSVFTVSSHMMSSHFANYLKKALAS